MNRYTRIPIAIALLALSLLVPAAASAAERSVSVTATATLKVPNDSAGLGFSVARERGSRGAALSAVSTGLRGVIGAVERIPGVGAGDVTTGRISVRKSPRGRQAVYRATEGIGVTLHQPEKAGELVSAAIGAGATGVSGPNFFVGDTEAAFANALAAAFGKARAKATTLATAAGATLGGALEIDEGEGAEFLPGNEKAAPATGGCATSGPTPQRTSSKRCTTAPPPVKPGSSTVTATVHAIFALQ
jgi:uncharacterized protein